MSMRIAHCFLIIFLMSTKSNVTLGESTFLRFFYLLIMDFFHYMKTSKWTIKIPNFNLLFNLTYIVQLHYVM